MRRRVAAGLLGGACALLLGAGCGDPSLADQLDDAQERVVDLEDRYRDLIRERGPVTTEADETAAPTTQPPPTVAPTTAPPTTAEPTTTTTAPLGADIEAASAGAVRGLVGSARWDEGLPIPAACLASAVFNPNGPDGAGGGTITCTVPFPPPAVGAFVERVNDERNLIATGGGTSFQYGGVATITIGDGPDGGASYVATQTYEFQ